LINWGLTSVHGNALIIRPRTKGSYVAIRCTIVFR